MKKSFLISCAAAAMLLAAPVATQSKPLLDGLYPQMGETMYLIDSCACGQITKVFRVLIDDADSVARLVPVGETVDIIKVDCAGTTPDGKRLYLVSKYTGENDPRYGRIGYMDLESGTIHNPDGSYADDIMETPVYVREGSTSGPMVEHLVLGAFSSDGTFYVASQQWGSHANRLFRLDVTTGVAESLGAIWDVNNYPNVPIPLHGADLAFTADDRMFLWTNAGDPTGQTAPRKGLYEVFLGTPVVAKFIGYGLSDSTAKFTGIAFRTNGFFEGRGELVASDRCDGFGDNMVVLALEDPDSGQVTIESFGKYPMCDCGGEYDYTYGDMANGPLGFFPYVATIGYWKNHPWRYIDGIDLAIDADGDGVDDSPTDGIDTSVMLCEDLILEEQGKKLLRTATNRNFSMLTAQLIAAKLNTSGGVGLSFIDGAEAFLCDAICDEMCEWDMQFDDKTQKAAANVHKEALDAFNNGSAISER